MKEKESKKPNNTALTRVEPREITEELRDSYLDYAMSVIVARALPDVRDGLKPVHLRIFHFAILSSRDRVTLAQWTATTPRLCVIPKLGSPKLPENCF